MAKKKQAAKEKKPYNVYKVYEVKDKSATVKSKECPKCGPGVYMGKHKDRMHCGKCSYTEFSS